MQAAATFDLSSTMLAAIFTALGVLCKSLWDSHVGFLDKTRLEKWKIDVDQKERKLSEFHWLNVSLRSFHPDVSVFPDRVVWSTSALSFSRIARRSLALRPAHSRCHQFVTRQSKASATSLPP